MEHLQVKEPEIKANTIYVLLHYRMNDPDGGFHWALGTTGSLTDSIKHYHANNPAEWEGRPVLDVDRWHSRLKAWDPAESKSLILAIEIKNLDDLMASARSFSKIQEVGKDIMNRKSVSEVRGGEPFTCRTWALDTLVASGEMEAEETVTLDKEANAFARARRDEVRDKEGPNALLQPGKYSMCKWVP
ncbi:hypothetical protein GGR56DRAFT_694132 [Xylariaceae sp. FL0804]|nr:hypothetical protein GGR56DRAFT_694132 [Xylariaceae sp. FL0804]